MGIHMGVDLYASLPFCYDKRNLQVYPLLPMRERWRMLVRQGKVCMVRHEVRQQQVSSIHEGPNKTILNKCILPFFLPSLLLFSFN